MHPSRLSLIQQSSMQVAGSRANNEVYDGVDGAGAVTTEEMKGAVQRSCSLLQTHERNLKRGGGRCVGGGR